MNQADKPSQAKQPNQTAKLPIELTEKEREKLLDHYYTLYPSFKPVKGSASNSCDPAYELCDSCKANWIPKEPPLKPSSKNLESPAAQSATSVSQTTS